MDIEKISNLVSRIIGEPVSVVESALKGEGTLSLHQLQTLASAGLETSLFLVGIENFMKAKKELGLPLESKDNTEENHLKSEEARLREFSELKVQEYSVNKSAYKSWEIYRKNTHKKVSTKKSKAKDYLLLRKYPHDIQLKIIEKSMGEGWIGLFPPSWERVVWKNENRTGSISPEDNSLLEAFGGQ